MPLKEIIEKHKDSVLSIVAFEIPDLDLIRGAVGQEATDEFLKSVLDSIRSLIRKRDYAEILDETRFLVFLSETEPQFADKVIDRIKNAIGNLEIKGTSMSIALNPVVIAYPRDGKSEEELLEKISSALERARVSTEKEAAKAGLSEVFVGRSKELKLLSDLFKEASEGKFITCLVRGKMGIGKTALLDRFAEMLSGSGAVILRAKSLYYEEPVPFQLFYDIFSKQEANRGSKDKRVNEILNRVKDLIYNAEETKSSKEKLFFATSKALEDLSSDHPVVILADDIHWIDPASSDLLKFLASSPDNKKVLFVGAYSEDLVRENLHKLVSTLADTPNFSSLKLRELSEMELMLYVMQKSGAKQITPRLAGYLEKYTEGIPFFLKEILEELERRGYLITTGDGLGLKEVPDLLPENLKNYVLKRFNFWDRELQKFLQTASAFGEEFPFPLLKSLIKDFDDESLLQAVDKAIKAEIIKKVAGEHDLYRFSPRILWQVFHDTQSPSRQRALHREILGVLERARLNKTPRDLLNLAWHAASGGENSKAIAYLDRASSLALENFQYRQAFNLLKKAVDILKEGEKGVDPEIRWRILEKFGEISLYINPQYSLEAMKLVVDGLKNREKKAKALLILGEAEILLGDGLYGEGHLKEALHLMENLRNVPGMLRCYRELGDYYLKTGENPQEAERKYYKAIALITEGLALEMEMPEVERELSRIYGSLGNLYFNVKGDLRKARFYFEKQKNITEGLLDKLELANTHLNLGRLYRSEGDWQSSLFQFKKAREIYNELELNVPIATVQMEMGYLEKISGEYGKAIEHYTLAVKILEMAGRPRPLRADALEGLAVTYLRTGDFMAAFNALDQVKNLIQNLDTPMQKLKALLTEGELYRRLGYDAKALTLLSSAYQTARNLSDLFTRARSGLLLADALTRSEPTKALEVLDELSGNIEKLDMGLYLWYRISRARALVLAGKPEEAMEVKEIQEKLSSLPGFESLYEYHLVLGMAHFYMGNYNEAEKRFRKALEEAQRRRDILAEFEAYNWLYRADNKLGRDDEARSHLEKASSILERIKNTLPPSEREGSSLAISET